MTSKPEEELRRITVEIRMLEQTVQALQSRLSMINAVMTDLTYASLALDGVEKEKEDSPLLVSIGGSSYVTAKLGTPDRVIVGMGAGVSVEKNRQEAKEILSKRLENMDITRTSVQQQLTQVAGRIEEEKDRFEALAATMREGKT